MQASSHPSRVWRCVSVSAVLYSQLHIHLKAHPTAHGQTLWEGMWEFLRCFVPSERLPFSILSHVKKLTFKNTSDAAQTQPNLPSFQVRPW